MVQKWKNSGRHQLCVPLRSLTWSKVTTLKKPSQTNWKDFFKSQMFADAWSSRLFSPAEQVKSFPEAWNQRFQKTEVWTLERQKESEGRAGGAIIPHPGGAPLFRLLLLSVTRLHMELRATRAISRVMLKLRRYHSLREKHSRFSAVGWGPLPCTRLTCCSWRDVFCFCPGSFCKTLPFLCCSGTAAALQGHNVCF